MARKKAVPLDLGSADEQVNPDRGDRLKVLRLQFLVVLGWLVIAVELFGLATDLKHMGRLFWSVLILWTLAVRTIVRTRRGHPHPFRRSATNRTSTGEVPTQTISAKAL